MCTHEDAPCCHGAHPPRGASRAPRGQNRREVTKRALQPTGPRRAHAELVWTRRALRGRARTRGSAAHARSMSAQQRSVKARDEPQQRERVHHLPGARARGRSALRRTGRAPATGNVVASDVGRQRAASRHRQKTAALVARRPTPGHVRGPGPTWARLGQREHTQDHRMPPIRRRAGARKLFPAREMSGF